MIFFFFPVVFHDSPRGPSSIRWFYSLTRGPVDRTTHYGSRSLSAHTPPSTTLHNECPEAALIHRFVTWYEIQSLFIVETRSTLRCRWSTPRSTQVDAPTLGGLPHPLPSSLRVPVRAYISSMHSSDRRVGEWYRLPDEKGFVVCSNSFREPLPNQEFAGCLRYSITMYRMGRWGCSVQVECGVQPRDPGFCRFGELGDEEEAGKGSEGGREHHGRSRIVSGGPGGFTIARCRPLANRSAKRISS